MEHSRNGDVTVTYEQQAMFGRRRNGGLSAYLDLEREAADAGMARRPLPPHGAASRRRTYADGELDVFTAERYFKGAMDGGDYKVVDVVPAVVPAETAAAAAARPTVAVSRPAWTRASVASAGSGASANSQTGLLRDERRRPGYRGGKCCVHVGGLLRSCSGKRSVRVDGGAETEATGPGDEPAAASRIEWYRDLRMDKAGRLGLAGDGIHGVVVAGLPPNLNLGSAKVVAIGREEKAAAATAGHPSASFRRNFPPLAPAKATVPSPGSAGTGDDDDDAVGSESSSDLFEIKSLMIDDCPYEPSEASIQWSVVTASAADVPVSSERGGVRTAPGSAAAAAASIGNSRGRPPVAAVRQQHRQDRPPGLLTGCVSHRAVAVSSVAAVRRTPGPPAASPATRRPRTDVSRHAQNGHL